ncbi:hypothetical protein Mesop_0199 [Mesorhizobium opportunistum WSM2075]|uniref:Uncharacterized protein n=1 Tax=Mesorhizobium opportunistum (strain LMG 24607 / HAMBI 3007 / WSM2075) TaxID=536019 RepID=F7XZ49_MESOW|nr:hypothetical protein Mesop_0199 [Mesorhizobium opportunistum WSM2075]
MVLLNTLREVTAKEVEAQDMSAHVGIPQMSSREIRTSRTKRKPG